MACPLRLPASHQRSLVEVFRPMADPRRRQGRRFPRPAVLALVIPENRPTPELFATVIAHPDYGLRLLRSK
jgi:hypothetical protein